MGINEKRFVVLQRQPGRNVFTMSREVAAVYDLPQTIDERNGWLHDGEGSINPRMQAVEHLEIILRWVSSFKQASLTVMGIRWLCVLLVLSPALVNVKLPSKFARWKNEFAGELKGDPEQTGQVLRRVLRWVSAPANIELVGLRGYVLLYATRNDLLGGMTCEAIGRMKGTSRQGVNKLVQEFRDAFGGMMSQTMRSESNRKRCRKAKI